MVSTFYRGGVSRGDNLHWEINGSIGDLVLTFAIGKVQVADLKLEGGRNGDATVSELPIPPHYYSLLRRTCPKGPSNSVGCLYAQFAKDLRDGTLIAPDFAHAVARHKLMDAIQLASQSGCVQRVG